MMDNRSMLTNRTRSLLARGAPALGTLSFLSDPAAIEIMGWSGLDYVMIDMEHTATDMGSVVAMIRAADATGITPLVRVPALDTKMILRALESGAQGIVVPSVGSRAEARVAVEACRYAPAGTRGTCRMARAAHFGEFFGNWTEHIENLNNETLVIGLVEDAKGAGEIEGIVEELDIVMVGRADLASDLGVPGALNDPAVLDIVTRCERAARLHHKPVGIMCYSAEEAHSWIERGYRFITYATDVQLLRGAYVSWLDDVRSGSRDEEREGLVAG